MKYTNIDISKALNEALKDDDDFEQTLNDLSIEELEESYNSQGLETLLICRDCLNELYSRGEKVLVGDTVERYEIEDEGGVFECCLCGNDWLYGEEPNEYDELIECIF